MKKRSILWIMVFLAAGLLMGCGDSHGEKSPAEQQTTVATEPAATQPPETLPPQMEEPPTEEPVQNPVEYEEVYAEQIGRYYTALSEQWDEGRYFEENMSALPYYYYEGNPLENVGYCFPDLDKDGQAELVIGAIAYADRDPSVFEIWTLVDGEPMMLAQGGSRNRYCMQYWEEKDLWTIANDGSSSAAHSASHYMMLSEGQLVVMEAIVIDGFADAENPWFLAYDLDWDVSNDIHIDEQTATAIRDANHQRYAPMEYIPYSEYR